MFRIAIVIPAFNAAETLPLLCDSISVVMPGARIVIVDDGSLNQPAESWHVADSVILRHDQNRGKGEALKTGFKYAIENGFDGVITIDADLQHDPAEIPRLITSIRDDHTVIVGTRALEPAMPLPRRISNTLSSFVASLCGNARFVDSQSGFRFIPVSLLKSIELQSSNYNLEPELLIRAARLGYKTKSVPISTIYNSSRSFINPLTDTFRFLEMVTKSLFW
jgi:glycosyltransferase involved in cell wall biosynthesis